MKYKKGDRVRITPDLVEGDPRFDNSGVDDEMEKLSGKIVTIARSYDTGRYLISEDHGIYIWEEDMFSGIAEFQLCDLESRMVVETRASNRYFVVKEDNCFYFMNTNGETHIKLITTCGTLYDDNMRHCDTRRDIMKVYEKVDCLNQAKITTRVLWERKEPKKMTLKEIEKELGYAVEVVLESEANNEE